VLVDGFAELFVELVYAYEMLFVELVYGYEKFYAYAMFCVNTKINDNKQSNLIF
jgi:hypothetical protein